MGQVGPDYIPGHAHSDTFNFVVQSRGEPFIVDVGISTYEKNKRRNLERSTVSHNTVMIDGKEQTDVWGGFRVGKRTKVIFIEESSKKIKAIHDAYQKIKCQHQRTFIFEKNEIKISDKTLGERKATAFLHFHPKVQITIQGSKIQGDFGSIEFENCNDVYLEEYHFAKGFNQLQVAQKVIINFKKSLNTKILFL